MSGKLARYVLIASTAIAMAVPSTAALAASRTTKGALIGAGVGLLSGNGIKGALGGAVAGAGVGAITEKGKKGKKSRKGAKVGAVVGAGVGLLAGDGLDGALKGAAAGAVGGSLLGRVN